MWVGVFRGSQQIELRRDADNGFDPRRRDLRHFALLCILLEMEKTQW